MNPKVAIVAHRGASADAPENTLSAVKLGWEHGADAVEIDVHLTRDGEVAVIHDPTLLRTTGRDARVDELTMAQIKGLDAGVWKGGAWRGERVPTLGEVLATVPAGRKLFIELKQAEGLAPALLKVISASGVEPGRINLISFERGALRDAKRVLPGCGTLFLADTPQGHPSKHAGLIALCLEEKFDGLGVSAGWPVTAELVQRLSANGLQLHVWTVNEARRARQLAEAGVASITTDRPGWLREQLAEA